MTDEIKKTGSPYEGKGGSGIAPQTTIVYTPPSNVEEGKVYAWREGGYHPSEYGSTLFGNWEGGGGGGASYSPSFLEMARSRFVDALKAAPIHPDDVVTVSWEGASVQLTGLEALALIQGEDR